jgi:uncharacterized membrane protein
LELQDYFLLFGLVLLIAAIAVALIHYQEKTLG